MMKTFSIGGIHPNDNKISKDCKIEVLPVPSKVFISVAQHLGAPATPVVKVGDQVKVGQVIAEPAGFISAYVKVNNYSKESIQMAKKLMAPVADHLMDGCIGSIAEIFDGDDPHVSRGCYAQAWSVGEMLRAYVEDILEKECV